MPDLSRPRPALASRLPSRLKTGLAAALLAGAGLAFLWFNAHPAQVFMGDVGALSLGGALGTEMVRQHAGDQRRQQQAEIAVVAGAVVDGSAASAREVSGVSSEGLKIMALPAASAGATLVSVRKVGEFNGTITATTPSGERSA